jgi:uncharacterized protein (DUF2062 family)
MRIYESFESTNLYLFMKKIKLFFKKFFLINDTPHKVAAGAALGIFLGIVPGEGLLTTLAVASLFRFNRLSATVGVMSINMWGTVLFLPVAAAVGGTIFGENIDPLISNFNHKYHFSAKILFSKAVFFDIALPIIVGFLIAAGIFAIAIYFILLYLLQVKHIHFSKKLHLGEK